MVTVLRLAAAALLVVALATSSASAQCSFPHPLKAKSYKTSLVQAFIPCDQPSTLTPNTTTEGGVPACAPPETQNEAYGNPANGWLWGPSSDGRFSLRAAKNKIPPLDFEHYSDVIVALTLDQVFDAHGAVANAPGTLVLILRMTLDDPANGDMTTLDFPIQFPITVQGNQVNLKTSVNARLNEMSLPHLPNCTSIEVIDVSVLDENGNAFATAGVYLPTP